jgi:predicted dehydrogenase
VQAHLREIVVNQTVRMGIVGRASDRVGRMAQSPAARPAREPVTGGEPEEELHQQAQEGFRLQTSYQDCGQMFEREGFGAIPVCVDSAGDVSIVEDAAKHGPHVHPGKPMAATHEYADSIIAAAEESGIKVMIGYRNYFRCILEDRPVERVASLRGEGQYRK